MGNGKRDDRRNGPVLIGIILLLMAGAFVSVIGFSDGYEEDGHDAADNTAAPGFRKVRIVLDGYPNASHAFLFAAEAKGYLREAGFLLEPVVAGPNDDPLAMVDAGKADLALASQPEVLLARGDGRMVVSVAAIVQRPLVYLMVPKDSPIHRPDHLDGKTVAWSGSPVHEAMLETMLEGASDGKPQVTLVKAEGRYADMVFGGRADALIGPTILDGMQRLERGGRQFRTIEPMLYGVPRYYETVLAAGERALAENPDLYARIWSALARGFEYASGDPEGAAKLLSDAGVFDGNPPWTVSLESLTRQLPFMQPADAPFGSQDKEVWKETEKWLVNRGLIGHAPFTGDAYVNLAGKASE